MSAFSMPPALLADPLEEARKRALAAGAGSPGGMPPMVSAPPVRIDRPLGDTAGPTMPPAAAGMPADASGAKSGAMPPAFFAGASAAPHQPSTPAPAVVNQNTMPAANVGPAQQQLQDLNAQGRPELHGWKQALDVLSQVSPLGRTIERNISGSPGNYDAQLANLSKQALGEQQAQNVQSEIRLRDEQGQQYDMTPVKVPWQDEPVLVPRKDAARLQQEIGRGTTAQTVATTNAEGKASVAAESNATKRDIATQGNQTKTDIAASANQNRSDIAAAGNKSKEQIAEENRRSREGVASAHNQVQRELAQFRQEAPTTASRTMAEMAGTVQKQVPTLNTEIDHLANAIGPAVGRWNQFMVNKGGADFPEFAGLDTDLDLFASALVRTHFGARGGQQYREELRKQFSEAQSPADLKARIAHAEKWIQGYAELGNPKGGGAAPAAGGKILVEGKDF